MSDANAVQGSKSISDQFDNANTLAAKLHALLMMTYGEAGESFRSMNDKLQDDYLWACAGMATELQTAVAEIDQWRISQRTQVS